MKLVWILTKNFEGYKKLVGHGGGGGVHKTVIITVNSAKWF